MVPEGAQKCFSLWMAGCNDAEPIACSPVQFSGLSMSKAGSSLGLWSMNYVALNGCISQSSTGTCFNILILVDHYNTY